jgi:transposase
MRQKDPLRALSEDERSVLQHLSRSSREPAAVVARAKAVLAVAEGATYTEAAHTAGRRSGDAVGRLVACFNRAGVEALVPGHAGGQPARYTRVERERILAEAGRTPQQEPDGTAAWSLTTVQRALRRAPDGLPQVSTSTIWCVRTDAGWSWQRTRSWCPTGTAVRMRQRGRVVVHDPDADAKKGSSSTPTARRKPAGWPWPAKTKPGPSRRCRLRGRAGRLLGTPPTTPTSTCASAPPPC